MCNESLETCQSSECKCVILYHHCSYESKLHLCCSFGHFVVKDTPKMFGRHIVFAFVVCLSVRPSRCTSVRIKLVPPSQVKLLVGFQQISTGVTTTRLCCAYHRQVPFHCTKLPTKLKLEISCPVFTAQTAVWISTNPYRRDQFYP
jgi:hypothetical protein